MKRCCHRYWLVLVGAAMLCLADLQAPGQEAARRDQPHWSFAPLRRPRLPRPVQIERIRTAIDAFILERLSRNDLALSVEADRPTLLRRAFFDLVGLPPSLDDVAEFLHDTRPDAYERLLDRLLASPHFGERWGRHWLDGAGYVDVTGTDNDAGIIRLSPGKWRYRDYVIRAINQDRPLPDFLVEQIAGDELVDWRNASQFTPEIQEKLIATGFLRMAADDTEENELNTPDIRHGVLQRTGEVLANNLLALTVNCAKCHDHPFEPISQKEYYSLLAVLAPVFNPVSWVQPSKRALADIAPGQRKQFEKHNAELDQKIGELKKRKGTTGIADLERQRKTWDTLQVAYDVGPPTPFRLLKRGNHLKPGVAVEPGLPGALGKPEVRVQSAKPQGVTSGRRLALAHWLTTPDSPAYSLLLRVQVNRIWQRLFGKGLVESADNLGVSGTRPTHPELLDWLAAEYQSNGGRLKPLLRLIMMSSVYRQASAGAAHDVAARKDPENHLLWRMPLRRLEAEYVRDALLAVSGKLERVFGGPPVPTEGGADGRFVVKDKDLPPGTSPHRRSIYLLARRNYHPTLLSVFDQPLMNTNCMIRPTSAVVLQSLTMLNDDFVVEQARRLAKRVTQAETVTANRITLAYRIVLGRDPSERESALCSSFLASQKSNLQRHNAPANQAEQLALDHLCHMLLNTSEFLYVP